MVRILGVDAGFENVGIAIVEDSTVIYADSFKTKKADKKRSIRVADDDASRCQEITRHLSMIVTNWGPAGVVVELPSGGTKSSRAARCMGLATGIIAAFIELKGLPVEWVTPGDVKKATVGRLDASKEEVQAAVQKRLKWPTNFLDGSATKWAIEHAADAAGAVIAAENGLLMRALKGR